MDDDPRFRDDDSRYQWYQDLKDGKLDKPQDGGDSDDSNRYFDHTNEVDDDSNEARNAEASKSGRLREELALAGSDIGRRYWGPSMKEAVNAARDAEKGGDKKDGDKSGFVNNTKGRSLEQVAAASMPLGKFVAQRAKKLGPFGTVILILMIAGGAIMGTQSLAPFGIMSNAMEHFNVLRTSMNRRTTYFQRFMLSSDRNIPVTKGATIFKPESFKIKSSIKRRMGKNGITVVNDKDAKVKYLVYKDDTTGKKFAISANDSDISKIPSRVTIDGETIEFNSKMKLDDALLESDGFFKSFDKSTRTLKGHIAGWFDDMSELIHTNRFKTNRNRMKDAKGDDASVDRAARSQGMNEGIANTEAHGKDGGDLEVDTGEVDEETRTHIMETEPIGSDSDGRPGSMVSDDSMPAQKNSTGTPSAQLQNETAKKITSKLNKVARAAGGINLACAILKVVSNFSQLVAGLVKANIINYASTFLEVVSKAKSGDDMGALNVLMNRLFTKGDTISYSNGKKVVKSNTSSMESTATNEFFSDGKVVIGSDQESKEIAADFNSESTMKTALATYSNGGFSDIGNDFTDAMSKFSNAKAAFESCVFVSAGVALASITAEFIGLFTFGIGNVVKQFAEGIISAAAKAALSIAISKIVSLIVPYVAKMLVTDYITNTSGGEAAAYALSFGAKMIMGTQMQGSSGLPATKETLMAFYKVHQEVVASEAEIERQEHSPFDATNKYTFLGSIVNSLTPLALTMGSPITTMSKTMTTIGSSIGNLLPTASAEGEVNLKSSISSVGDCPSLDTIHVVGDAACNPYFVTDVSTIDMDPAEVFNKVAADDNDNFITASGLASDDDDTLNNNGNPDINPKSKLGKWVIACASRDSQFGVVDANVLNAVQLINSGDSTLDSVVGAGISMVPFVGDLVDMADAAAQLGSLGWATGENCVSEEYKYYSRYSEDQRLMESAGIIEESAVARLLDNYYKENPIDDSLEGTIARYSGLTKDDVTETLAAMDYIQFIAEYNPGAYGPEKKDVLNDEFQYEGNEIIVFDNPVILGKNIIYADLRNRTKIA